jgi:hypothetical protein
MATRDFVDVALEHTTGDGADPGHFLHFGTGRFQRRIGHCLLSILLIPSEFNIQMNSI